VKAGWTTKRLGEIAEFKPPKSEARERFSGTEEVAFLPMEDLSIAVKYPVARQVKRLDEVVGSYTYFADGDLLLAKITPCFENGKLGIARGLRNGIGFGSSEFIVIRSKGSVLSEWLFYFLSQGRFREEGARRMGGAVGQQRLPREFVEQYEIPFPPLPEQRRIVALLDAAIEGLATAAANAARNLQNARDLFESHLAEVFSRRGEGWVETTLGGLCEVKHGFAFEGKYFSNEGEFVLLTPGNFYESGGYRDRGEKQKYYTGPIPREFVLKGGDLLVAMTEQAVGLLGSPILVPRSGKFLHNQRLGLVKRRPNVEWDARFLFHMFNLPAIRKAIQGSASGTKVRHTSPTKIGCIAVHVPLLPIQRRVVAHLDAISTETQRLSQIYEQKQAALAGLKRSLLHQAFNGEL
jgi:type I restriction enzyme S subunit